MRPVLGCFMNIKTFTVLKTPRSLDRHIWTRIKYATISPTSWVVRWLGLAICVFLCLNHCFARDLFVNNAAGDDLFDGGAPTTEQQGHGPFQSLTRALKSALPGDRIILAKTDLPYRESVTLATSRLSGSAFQPFTIEGQGATFDGTRPVPPDAWEFVSGNVFRFQPEHMQFQQLYLDGVPALLHPTARKTGGHPDLQPREWATAEGWIYFRVDHGNLPEQYPLSYSYLQNAFTLYKVENVVINDIVVQGYVIDGVNLHDAHGPCILNGVTCRGNGRSGIAVVSNSQADLRACLIGDNGQSQVFVDSYSECNLANCDVIGNSAPAYEVREHSKLLIDGKPTDVGGNASGNK